MRRHQVLMESAFPVEAAGMLKNLENKGDPWSMGGNRRAEWIAELDFEVYTPPRQILESVPRRAGAGDAPAF
jgi:hypothetical protein